MKIRFATDILRRLGEELNPSMDRGILELVKNSYDADAVHCAVELEKIDQPGGTVIISDDGDGMIADEIQNGWLVLGHSSKDPKQRTRLGRIPAGSKGLGRLAALRMGTQALLTTRPRKEKDTEYTLLIDWSLYEGVELIDDVELTIEKAKRSPKAKPGTEIEIEGLRTKIGRNDAKRLARELLLLADPFGVDATGFYPTLRTDDFQDLEKLVSQGYFDESDYHMVARVDENGRANIEVMDSRGGILFSGNHKDVAPSDDREKYHCPPLTFEFWTFLLDSTSFRARSVSKAALRGWLGAVGGVHIYQNKLRVTPYGDPGNDWLDLNLSRVRSPEERPSTNNSIGRVVFNDTDTMLIQKTDRSGFIETGAFLEIRAFAQDALDWMARKRLEEAEKRRDIQKKEIPAATEASKKQLDAAVEKLPPAERESVKKAVGFAWKAVTKQFRQHESEIQLYRTLSTAGITAATFAHESAGSPLKVISPAIDAIERRGKKYLTRDVYDKQLDEPVNMVKNATRSLEVLSQATLDLVNHEKRRLGRVEIHGVFKSVLKIFKPFLDSRQIKAETLFCEGTPYLRGCDAAVESMLTNLLNNSIAAFEEAGTSERRILVATEQNNGFLTIRVSDTGPGVNGRDMREIWLPGITTRKNGTGLGLTIVKDTVTELGGEVSAIGHGELGGAEILIRLPILGG
jgi:signal transduction histidine kinase